MPTTLPNDDTFQKSLKLRRTDFLPQQDGASQEVRMPDRSVNLIVTREGDQFRLGLAEGAHGELASRVQQWLRDFAEKKGVLMDTGTLRTAFEGVRSQYRAHHKPQQPITLPSARPQALAITAETIRTYSAQEAIEAMKGGKRLKWGLFQPYGTECVEVAMPDSSTNLIIRRCHTNEGTRHEAFPAAPQANDTLSQHLDTFLQNRSITVTAQGGMSAGDVCDLLQSICRMECNRTPASWAASAQGGRNL